MTNFSNFTDAILSAFKSSGRRDEIVAKKHEILREIYRFHNFEPSNVLFVGFSPAILAEKNSKIYVTEISDSSRDFLDEAKVKYEYIATEQLSNYRKKFDVVVALDEFFTFGDSDQFQQQQIALFCGLTKEIMISTLKDYKNLDFKEREFSHPALIRSTTENSLFCEFHDWSLKDRANWKSWIYEITNPTNAMTAYGPFQRRTMYFKQLAKFSKDAGADDFLVHRNLMYKGITRKNYEHVISVRFDEYNDEHQ